MQAPGVRTLEIKEKEAVAFCLPPKSGSFRKGAAPVTFSLPWEFDYSSGKGRDS